MSNARPRIIPAHLHQILANEYASVFYGVRPANMRGAGTPEAIAFTGKSGKPAWAYTFKTIEQMMEVAQKHLDNVAASKAQRAEWKDAKKATAHAAYLAVEVGQILYNTWGYEQTNCDFYEVVGKTGKMLKVCKIKAAHVPGAGTCSMSGRVVPVTEGTTRFVGEIFLVQAGKYTNLGKDAAGNWDSVGISWYG